MTVRAQDWYAFKYYAFGVRTSNKLSERRKTRLAEGADRDNVVIVTAHVLMIQLEPAHCSCSNFTLRCKSIVCRFGCIFGRLLLLIFFLECNSPFWSTHVHLVDCISCHFSATSSSAKNKNWFSTRRKCEVKPNRPLDKKRINVAWKIHRNESKYVN